MSNEQKRREALQAIADWDSHDVMLGVDFGSNGVRDFYRRLALEALATTEPEPTGMPDGSLINEGTIPEPLLHPVAHIELGDDSHDVVTLEAAKAYGEQCWKAGCKHGAWADKPVVNQQLTTEPVDEREAFEKVIADAAGDGAIRRWPNDKGESYENARVQDYRQGWVWCLDWLARAAMAQVGDINVVESFTNDTKDAERYRWLADSNNYHEAINLISDGSLTEDALGKAIDAEMAKGVKG